MRKKETYSEHLKRLTNVVMRQNPGINRSDAKERARTTLNNRMIYPSDAALIKHGDHMMKTQGEVAVPIAREVPLDGEPG